MTLSELTKQTVEAAEAHSPFEGYKWEIEAIDVLKLLVGRNSMLDVLHAALAKCPPDAWEVALLLQGAIEKDRERWPSEE